MSFFNGGSHPNIRDFSSQLKRIFGASVFERGHDYARQGRVESLSSTANDGLVSRVRGSGGKTYVQSINWTLGPDAKVASVTGTCTCPVGLNCKHIVAATLRAADQKLLNHGIALSIPPASPVGDDKHVFMSKEVEHWLAQVKEATQANQEIRNAYAPHVRDRLLYVLHIEKPGSLAPVTIATLKGSVSKTGALAKGARPYSALDLSRREPPQFILESDLRIARRIERLGLSSNRYGYSAPTALTGEVLTLLQEIARTGRGYLETMEGPLLIAASVREASIAWAPMANGSQRPVLLDQAGAQLTFLPTDPPVWIDPASGAFGPLKLDVPPQLARALMAAPPIPAEATMVVADHFRSLASKLGARSLPAPSIKEIERRQGKKPIPTLTLLPIEGVVTRWDREAGDRRSAYSVPRRRTEAVICPVLRLAFDYQGQTLPSDAKADHRFEEDGRTVVLQRDAAAESAAIDRLVCAGATLLEAMRDIKKTHDAHFGDFVLPLSSLMVDEDAFDDEYEDDFDFGDIHSLAFTDADVFAFMEHEVADLRAEGWRVEIAAEWPWRLYEGPITLSAGAIGDVRSADWFALGLTLEAGGEKIDLAEVLARIVAALPLDASGALPPDLDLEAALEDMTMHKRLANGTFVTLDTEQLIPLVRVFLASRSLFSGFHLGETGRLSEVAEALAGCGVPFEGGEALLDLGARLRALTLQPLAEPPAPLKAILRAYQQTGYGWLRALAETGFGGVLADDMGLGKTIQTLALLLDRHVVRGADRPSLLIVPTSLVGTWMREAERFAPDLSLLVLHGGGRREHFDKIDNTHLVITTYPLLLRDHAKLLARDWDLAILDEAQAVKNTSTAAAKHIRGLKARSRIALTGTPMENNLEEFWALFDWLVPGLLGDRKSFNARFRHPIERGGSMAAQEALNARVRPFLLRRTKDMVAGDLPAKTIITETIMLGEKQRALYEAIRLSMDARVREAIAAKGFAASRITILSALLKLRQVCCDPELLKSPEANGIQESAKRSRLLELLGNLIAEGRRVVVFSQFVGMLNLIKADVEQRGWDHAWLTGDTKDRDGAISRFQKGKTPLFLISLKAGGVGLTLTAADTVILYDPWWNPAAERQAMDRVHRIGQNRAIFVYRLVAEGAVEESILALQDKKQALADALFEGPGGSPLGLQEADIAQLFKPLPPHF